MGVIKDDVELDIDLDQLHPINNFQGGLMLDKRPLIKLAICTMEAGPDYP